MRNVCLTGDTVGGYDVSHYQSNLYIHQQMAQAGKKFCFIKADEGRVVDSMFSAHWGAAQAAGMIVGAYDFFHPSEDPLTQAQNFDRVVGKLGPGTLGPVIDWETSDGTSAITDLDRGLAWLLQVRSALGRDPIIYGSPYFLQALGLDARFNAFALWIAQYGSRCPLIPPPWSYCSFWQFTDGGSSNLDLNLFNGNLTQLQKMAAMAP